MNFIIFDNDLSSLNIINQLLSDSHNITLITSNESLSTIPSLVSIKQNDISNASQVIQNLSVHEYKPFDAIFIFNLSSYKNLNNVLKSMERLKREQPPLFLFFVGQQNEIDKNINKLLKECSQSIQWTIIISNEINSLISTKYQIKTTSDSTNQQSINATDLLHFLYNELNTQQYIKQTIYFYSS